MTFGPRRVITSLRVALVFLRGDAMSLALSVGALACAVALVCAIDIANRGVLRGFGEAIDAVSGRAALQVSVGESALLPEEMATTVARVPGVRLAVPVVSAVAFVADQSGDQLTVHGVDVGNDDAIRVYQVRGGNDLLLDDPLMFLSQPDSILVTRVFAQRRHLRVDDRLELETPTGRHSFTIRGLLDPEGVARVYGGNLLVMDLFAAEATFTRAGFINRIDVVLVREDDVAEVAAAISAALPEGTVVEKPAQRKTDLFGVVRSLQVALQGIGFVGLLAAFLIGFNRLATTFDRQVWQIGVLRALGVPRGVLWMELIKQGLIVGGAGVALGLPAGVWLGSALLPIVANVTATAHRIVMPNTRSTIALSALGLGAVLGLGAAVLAAAIPAWRATGQAIAETTRSRGVEQPGSGLLWPLWIACGGGIAATVSLQAATRSATWGLVATVLLALAMALAARPLLQAVVWVAQMPRLAALAGPSGDWALATLAQSPRRAALLVATLGVGIGAVLWISTLGYSFERTVVEGLSAVFRGDLVVTSAHAGAGWLEAPLDEAIVTELEQLPGVAAVASLRMIDWPHEGGRLSIAAVDAAYFDSPAFGQWPLVERLPDVWRLVAGGQGVIASSTFLSNMRVRLGDWIVLRTPAGPLSVRIAGVDADLSSAWGTLEIDRALYQRHWNDHQVTRAFVASAPGTAVDTLRATIAQVLGRKYRLRILFAGELLAYLVGEVRGAFAGVHALGALVLVVVLVGMADTLAAGVAERTRQLGTLRAMGVQRRALRRMIMLEALALGGLGLVLAVTGGFTLGAFWVEATLPHLLGWILALHLPWAQAGLVAAATVAVCLLAALLPARKAAHLAPAVALRYE